jgi:hypothetical protein
MWLCSVLGVNTVQLSVLSSPQCIQCLPLAIEQLTIVAVVFPLPALSLNRATLIVCRISHMDMYRLAKGESVDALGVDAALERGP